MIPGPRTIDDAFITFRYARNIVHGAGFVYNAGERVLGTTTPFYTLWMAALSLITHSENYPVLALVTNALADAASACFLYHLGRRLSNSSLVGLAVALLWAVAPMSVTFAIGGMETSVFILLMLATFTAHLERRLYAAAVLAALALLTRPDAALIALLVFGQLVFFALRPAQRFFVPCSSPSSLATLGLWILTFVLVIAPWAIFATAYFGNPLSQSVFAKSIAYRMPPEAGVGRLIQHLSVPFFESDVLDVAGLIRLILYLTLYLIGALAAFRREPCSLPFFAYPLLYAAAFALANPLIFRWYLAPPLPAYFLSILLGIWHISSFKRPNLLKFEIRHTCACASRIPRPGAAGSGIAGQCRCLIFGMIAAIYLITSLRTWTLHPNHGPDRPAPQMAYIRLELLYHQVAADLKPYVSDHTVLAAGDIGALGYDTNARILDTLGLISPQTLRYYPLDPKLYVINYAVSPQLILDQQPDWLVAPEVYLRKGVLRSAQFQAQYQLFETIPTDIYGSAGLLVYKRR